MTSADLAPPPLVAYTVGIDDPGSLLALMPPSEPHNAYAWIRDGDGMVAWGEAARHKADSISEADAWWSQIAADAQITSELTDPPAGSGLMAFGSYVFDADNTSALSSLIVPRVVVGRRQGQSWLTVISVAGESDAPPVPSSAADLTPSRPPRPPEDMTFTDGTLDGDAWEAVVAEAVRRIVDGQFDKVVLARDLIAEASGPIDLRWIAGRLAADYRRCWTYVVDGLVGATPEMLVRRESGLATSRVLAGTIRRTGDDAQDYALAGALAESSKDLEEHEYAVASVARALAPYCSGMNVPDAPYVLALPNVMHLATDVTAVADHGASALALAAALHPSAAVCGTPTDLARATIAELEHLDRGRYAGPVGWIDASGDGEWAIALRCGQLSETDPRQIRLYAGCGIVAGSDPAAELAESRAKLIPMRSALSER